MSGGIGGLAGSVGTQDQKRDRWHKGELGAPTGVGCCQGCIGTGRGM